MPSGKRHYRLTLGDALQAHETAIEYGGLPGILNLSMVQSAIGRPYTGYYRPIRKKAAALVESMCCNHGFVDGNKRTCLILLGILFDRSGYRLVGASNKKLNDAVTRMLKAVAKGEMKYDKIEFWLAKRIGKKPTK